MSLLEDVFLQNEADEAQELERVIEGDEYDVGRPSTPNSDENSEKEDEAEEDKRRVDPSKAKEKRVVKNPRIILNPARLTGPRGIQIIPDHFKSFQFKGKGHEKEDLDLVLKKLEHWAYRLFPKFKFEDCLKKIETLGKKRPVMVHLHKIRTDQFTSEETVVQKDSSDEEDTPMVQEEDEFDKLLQQQIELARATPAPGSVKKGFDTPRPDRSLLMPKATSSPSINDEQRERMLKNKRLAEERRLAKLKQNAGTNDTVYDTQTHIHDKTNELNNDVKEDTVNKNNRSNVIDSSDEECDISVVNQSITVDIHNTGNKMNNIRKDSEDNQVMGKINDACNGNIELVPTITKDRNPVAEVTDSRIMLEDVELDVVKNKVENTVAEVGVNIQTGVKDTCASEGNIDVDVGMIKEGNAVAEVKDNSMDIPSESSKEKVLELDTDTGLEDLNSNNTDKDSITVKQIPGSDNTSTNDNKSKNNDSVYKSVANTDGDEMKGNDDLDVMDVDFSEEF